MARPRRLDVERLRLATTKLLTAGPKGWWLLLQAQIAILGAAAVVRLRPEGDLVRDLASRAGSGEAPRPSDADRVEAAGLAIDRMARFGFGRPLCLVRSLALQRLLERKRIPGSRIRVGVRMGQAGFEAHAWVEWNGRIVADDPSYVGLFQPFTDTLPVPAPRSWTRRLGTS